MNNSILVSSLLAFALTACDPLVGGKLPDGGNPPTGAVSLGTAGDFVILAKSGISTVPTSVITGDLGLSPAAATFATG